MSVHRMRFCRIALLGGFALSVSACANIWSFEDLRVAADASENVPAPHDASVDATQDSHVDAAQDSRVDSERDAGPLADADATIDTHDSTLGDATDAGDANDAGAVVCEAGFHNCAGTCSSNTSLDSCGPSSCVPCVIASSGLSLMCTGTACVSSCPPMLTLCDGGGPSGECVDIRSHPSHCGACANACPPHDGGLEASCVGGGCQ
jgi:hypothetical protein